MSYTRYKAHVGNRYTLELIRNTSSLSAPAREVVLMGAEPLIVEREDRSPLQPRWSTRCTMKLQSEIQYAFEHISRDEKNWYVKLFAPSQPNTPVFTGIIEQGLYEEQYEQLPYEVTLTATCGLKKLDDYYLDIDALPLNEKVLTPLYAVVKQCLKKARDLEINFVGEVGAWLTTSYIDPSGYRTNEDGERSSQKMGEVLDGIFSSLGLVVYLHENTWRVEEAVSSFSRETILFETKERPIYTTPSLSVEGKYGSVRINLPQDKLDSSERLSPVTFPLKPCSHPQPYIEEKITAPKNQISATAPLANLATLPSPLERSRGMQIRVPYIEDEAIAVTIPYRIPKDAKGLTFDIEIGFGKQDIDSTNGDKTQIQAVAEVKLIDRKGVASFMASGNTLCYVVPPTVRTSVMNDNRVPEETIHFVKMNNWAAWEGYSSDSDFSFSSVYTGQYMFNPKNKAMVNHWANNWFGNHLPWSKISKSTFRNGKMGTFSFSVLAPFPNTLFAHSLKKERSVGINEKVEIQYLVFYIPFRFWEQEEKQKTKRFQPTEVTIGKVSIRYDLREEIKYNKFILSDRGKDFVREGEEINLTLSTKIDSLEQPTELKGWLYNAVGEQLKEVGGMNLVERAAKNFFAVYGETQDRVTLRTPAKGPYSPIQQYRLKGRPGHTYYIGGSRWDVAGEEEELSLFEAPRKINEEVDYDL